MFIFYMTIMGLIAGISFTYLYLRFVDKQGVSQSKSQAENILKDAENKKKEIMIEAKEQAFQILEEAKKDEKTRREYLSEIEQRLEKKETHLDNKTESLDELKESLDAEKQSIRETKVSLQNKLEEQNTKLLEISKMSREEVIAQLMQNFEEEIQDTMKQKLYNLESEYKETAASLASEAIGTAIYKQASDVTAESTVTIVNIPSDDIKGRIIGREGRNINAFESRAGVDVIIDDTPGTILISGFDLVRRYVAKIALENLVADGRIHPTKIEESIEKAEESVNSLIIDFGEKALFELGITGIHPEMVKLLGRLRFRTSYGQNILRHSIECAYLAETMAHEIGADAEIAKIGALFHDVGKALTHESQESHVQLGVDVARKYGMDEKILNCIEAHHEDVPFTCVEAQLTAAADAISASRPGARRESVEIYIKRLRELEDLAGSFDGVKKAYAIQAGREVRIIVDPMQVDDIASTKLAHSIASKIQSTLTYPGQVKVNVTRETRVVDYAK
ncbi:MAG: ribonuclease Y [Patescibacteria group bacterium]|nr:ribonuclease Y [Patescibacteria group bacterium]